MRIKETNESVYFIFNTLAMILTQYKDTYSKIDVSFEACNHIPTDLHIRSQGIPLKCYTVRCYTSTSEVTGSCHCGKD